MKKRTERKRLSLSKETIRSLVSQELQGVVGGVSCGGVSACDCSSVATDTSVQSSYCTKPQM
jgi:hypothetical protein